MFIVIVFTLSLSLLLLFHLIFLVLALVTNVPQISSNSYFLSLELRIGEKLIPGKSTWGLLIAGLLCRIGKQYAGLWAKEQKCANKETLALKG